MIKLDLFDDFTLEYDLSPFRTGFKHGFYICNKNTKSTIVMLGDEKDLKTFHESISNAQDTIHTHTEMHRVMKALDSVGAILNKKD